MNKIELRDGDDLNVYVEDQLVLRIGQVSDDEVINLYFYPKDGNIVKSMLCQEDPGHGCTHELLCGRKSVKK